MPNTTEKVCVTGKYAKMTRAEIERVLKEKGYTFASSVTKDVTLVLCEDKSSSSSKLKKARSLGVEILTYEEFFEGAGEATEDQAAPPADSGSAAEEKPASPARHVAASKKQAPKATGGDDKRQAKLDAILGFPATRFEDVDLGFLYDDKAKNIFDWAVKKAQQGMSELYLQALLANVACGTRSDHAGDIFCPLFDPETQAVRVVEHMHDEPYAWAYAADSFEGLERKLEINERLSSSNIQEGSWQKLSSAVAKDASFWDKDAEGRLGSIPKGPLHDPITRLVTDWLSLGKDLAIPKSYDFSLLSDIVLVFVPKCESEGQKVMAYLDRARWITQLLDGSVVVSQEIPKGPEVRAEFEKAMKDESLPSHVPDALYWTLWAYIAGGPGDLEAVSAALKRSPSKLVKDCVSIISRVAQKGAKIGKVNLAEVARLNRLKYGIIDEKGEWVLPPKYSDAGGMSCGMIPVAQGAKWGFVDTDGKEIIPPSYDQVEPFKPLGGEEDPSVFAFARVTRGGETLVIDKEGNPTHLTFPEEKKDYDGRYPVHINHEKYGFMDRTGKVVVDLEFTYLGELSDGLAPASRGKGWGYVDRDGRVVIPLEFERSEPFCDGLGAVGKDGMVGMVNAMGEVVVPFKYSLPPEPFSDGLSHVYDGHGVGYIDKNGEEVIPLKQVWARRNFIDGFAAEAVDRHKWALIDKTGKPAFDYREGQEISSVGFGLWLLDTCTQGYYRHLYKIIDTKGNELHEGVLEAVEPFSSKGLTVVKFGHDYNLRHAPKQIWSTGCKPVHEGSFVEITPLDDNFFAVQQFEGNVGIMNHQGKLLLPAEYSRVVPPIWNGLIRILDKENRWGIFNCTKGDWNVAPSLSWIGSLREIISFNVGGTRTPSYFNVTGGKWGFMDAHGKTLIDLKFNIIKSPMTNGRAVMGVEE